MPDELEQVAEQVEADESTAFDADEGADLGLGAEPEKNESEQVSEPAKDEDEPAKEDEEAPDTEQEQAEPEDDDVKRGKEIIESRKAEQERQERQQQHAPDKPEGPPDLRQESFDSKMIDQIAGFVPKNLFPKETVKLSDGTELDFNHVVREFPEIPVMIATVANNIIRQMAQSGFLMTGDRYQGDVSKFQENLTKDRFVRTVTHPQYGVPEAKEIANSDDYKAWIKDQPEEIQALWASKNPWDVIRVLKRYQNKEVIGKAKEQAEAKDTERKEKKEKFDAVHKSTMKSQGKPKQSQASGKDEEAEAFYGDDDE